MRIRFLLLGISVLLLLSVSSVLNAQTSSTPDSACQTLIEQAFTTLSETCANTPGNSACFGNSANASFANGGSGTFAKAGDKVDLSTVQTIQTMPLDVTNNQWGLATLNVHANVPLALSDTGLKYILLGDASVENAVPADSAFQPVQSITVTPLVAANLRANPSTNAQVIVSAPVGTELSADALSADKAWLRVMNNSETVWVSRQIVAAKSGSIDDLPVVDTDTRTVMQSFFLHTGTDTPDCTALLPSMLIIQAPSGINATITANGANIRFESTIALRVTADNNLQLIALSGGASVGGVSLPAGFTLNVPLSADSHGVSGLPTGLRPITGDERSFLTVASNEISPTNVLYAPVTVPTADQIAAVMVQLNSSVAGQAATSGPASGKADCTRFKPTSPLGSLALGVTPFYWDGAQGATSYKINIYAADGSLRNSVEIASNTTTLQTDTAGAIGDGSNFAWEVQALVDGQVACTTSRVSLPRDTTPQFVGNTSGGGAAPTPCPWASC